MKNKKRKLFYRIFNPDYHYETHHKDYISSVNYRQCYTFKRAIRYARMMGSGTEIERIYLTGKHKGKCRVYVY